MSKNHSPKDVISAIKREDLAALSEMFAEDPGLKNVSTPFGSWLHVAAEYGKFPVVKFLAENGFDIDARGGIAGGSAINIAASEGCLDIVDYLLGRGAELDVSEPERNPLFSAVQGGHDDIVSVLLASGIDATVRYTGESMKDMDAAAYAREWGRTGLADMIEAYIAGSDSRP